MRCSHWSKRWSFSRKSLEVTYSLFPYKFWWKFQWNALKMSSNYEDTLNVHISSDIHSFWDLTWKFCIRLYPISEMIIQEWCNSEVGHLILLLSIAYVHLPKQALIRWVIWVLTYLSHLGSRNREPHNRFLPKTCTNGSDLVKKKSFRSLHHLDLEDMALTYQPRTRLMRKLWKA